MEQTSPDILIGMGKIRVERMITLSLRSVRLPVKSTSASWRNPGGKVNRYAMMERIEAGEFTPPP